jgi:nucleoside-diphosphate-sugar epimerase
VPRSQQLVNLDGLVRIDLSDYSGFRRLPRDFDAIVHVAALSVGGMAELMRSNFLATLNLLDYAELNGIGRIVHVSAISVYGTVLESQVSENSPVRHQNEYGASKWASECLLSQRFGTVSSISVRSPAIVGRVSHRHLLARLLGSFNSRTTPITLSNPDFLFNNLVHEDSLTDFLVNLLEVELDRYRAVPVGCSEPMPFRNVVDAIAARSGYQELVNWVESPSLCFGIDIQAAVELGFKPLTVSDSLQRWLNGSEPPKVQL